MIALEGFDGSGKSTFAKRIGLPVIHPGAPPKSRNIESAFFQEQLIQAGKAVVYDRITCVSQQVYQDRLFDPWYWNPTQVMVDHVGFVLVYCRPPDDVVLDFSRHTVADHDDPIQMEHVRLNARSILDRYDRLMGRIPHVKYDFTEADGLELIDRLKKSQFDESEWTIWSKEMRRTLSRS